MTPDPAVLLASRHFFSRKNGYLSSLFVLVRTGLPFPSAAGAFSGEPPVADLWRCGRASVGAWMAEFALC